ncbi:hypothetical protein [Janthinobacterium sp. FT14W]|uniref:hypothetical protein n=1 Tax=Janthinobacterium sp. FT14W TaxID=2654253 RepID=UPI00186ACB13|nr:hypothetical protein [Janthinobacterium sp. FT14W]
MASVTQQNASLVEEAVAAAESLRDQASHLVQTVSIFKTHDSHVATPTLAAASTRPSHKPVRLVTAPASSTAKRQAAPAKPRAVQAEAVTTGDWEEFQANRHRGSPLAPPLSRGNNNPLPQKIPGSCCISTASRRAARLNQPLFFALPQETPSPRPAAFALAQACRHSTMHPPDIDDKYDFIRVLSRNRYE